MIHRIETTRDDLAAPTRRRLLQLLRRTAVGSGALALGYEHIATARKKKCRRTCNSEEKCIRGKCVPIRRP